MVILLIVALDLSPFIALAAWGYSSTLGWIGLASASWAILLSVVVARSFGTSPSYAIPVPLNTILMGLVALRVVLGGGRSGRIEWRGNTYEIDELQQGGVVRFSKQDDRNATGEDS